MWFLRQALFGLAVACALFLGGSRPDAAPEFGEWSEPQMLGPAINSVPSYGPAVTRDGLTLYFTRGSGLLANLMVSTRTSVDADWETPLDLGSPVNTGFTEMIPALSRDEHFLFFTSDRPVSQSWDLWASWRPRTHDPFGWQEPFNLGPAVNTVALETTGSHWEGGENGLGAIFFASNRLYPGATPPPGGLPSGHDIYVSHVQPDGTLGPASRDLELSTDFAGVMDFEGRPMVRFDGRELIFVSDRPGGEGLQDLWVATRDSADDRWHVPVNLTTLNSEAGELHPYLSPDGQTLYFSRRTGGAPFVFVSTRQGPGRQGEPNR